MGLGFGLVIFFSRGRSIHKRNATGASSGDGQRGGASTAASRRSTEEADRALAVEIKIWKESDARMPALFAERSAAVE